MKRKLTEMDCTTSTRLQLEELLNLGSDIHLLFGDEAVPGHSIILRQWSRVLAPALDTECSSGMQLPMPGTSKADWLAAMEFVYPVVPEPDVTWSNLEVLLTVANKYDMPALLSKSRKFLLANQRQLDSNPTSPQFAWRWIALADRCGLPDVARDCINTQIVNHDVAKACKGELLAGVSPATMQHLVEVLTQQIRQPSRPGMLPVTVRL